MVGRKRTSVRLDHATWQEVERFVADMPVIILPTGSTEQHGPMGLIGTDAICAETIAEGAADKVNCLVAPTLSYTPAPFNMGFAGTVSIAAATFTQLVAEITTALAAHGFQLIYVLNGHGANIAPLESVAAANDTVSLHIRSWWDFDAVNTLRHRFYGDWEGMHATPSEVAITQASTRIVPPGDAVAPPTKLSPNYIAEHAGDRHGPPDQHRKQFPDGRVGSHSALAHPEQGATLLNTAIDSVAEDIRTLMAHLSR